jgi:hypothetical protein
MSPRSHALCVNTVNSRELGKGCEPLLAGVGITGSSELLGETIQAAEQAHGAGHVLALNEADQAAAIVTGHQQRLDPRKAGAGSVAAA